MFSWTVRFVSVCAGLLGAAVSLHAQEGTDWTRWSVSPGAGILIMGGGQPVDGGAGASLSVGYDMSEFWTLEASGMWAPYVKGKDSDNPDIYGASAGVLYHLNSYSRFDPYLAFGAGYYGASDRVFRKGNARGMAGPHAGFGTMYHFTESIALRADARAFMSVDTGREMAYLASVGLAFRWPSRAIELPKD